MFQQTSWILTYKTDDYFMIQQSMGEKTYKQQFSQYGNKSLKKERHSNCEKSETQHWAMHTNNAIPFKSQENEWNLPERRGGNLFPDSYYRITNSDPNL